MKKYHSILSLILVCALVLGLCATASAAGNYGPDVQVDKENRLNYPGNGNYDSNWMYWSQGASKHNTMRTGGCYSIALSKVIVEAGLKSSSEFNPDDHYRWGRDNGYLKGALVDNPTAMIEQYTGADVTVNVINYNYLYDKVNKKVMELLNDGYYVILFRPQGNNYSKHYVYVCREKSLEAGKAVISGSQSDIHSRTGSIYSLKAPYGFKDSLEKRLLAPLDELGYKNYITQIITVKVHSKGTGTGTIKNSATSNENKKTPVTFSNYQVRVLTETVAEPYATAESTGDKVTEVGMYIGLNKEKMTKLGSDNGTARYKKNMWYNTKKYGYPLEPGTTYYYQPYAVVGGKPYPGDIKYFTTPGQKPTKEDDTPKPCDHSYDSSGYCNKCGEEYPISTSAMSATTYEAVKNEVPVRNRPYAPDTIIQSLSKGAKVTVVASGKNSVGNLWYKLDDGTWVYSENLAVAKIKEPEKEEQTTPAPTPVDNRSWQDQGWTSKKPTESDTLKITDTRTVTDKAGYTTYTYYHYWAKKDGKTKMSYGNTYWKNYEEVTVTTAYPYYKTYDGKYKGYKAPSVPDGKHGTIWWLKSTNEVPAQTHTEYRYSVYK